MKKVHTGNQQDHSGSSNPKTDFQSLAESVLSRRAFLEISALGASACVAGTGVLFSGAGYAASRPEFQAVAPNTHDTVTVPEGYVWDVVCCWGDGMWSDSEDFDPLTRGTGKSQERAMGANNDGMALFVHQGKTLLAINNEFFNIAEMYANRDSLAPESEDDVRKGKAAVGVSICEISKQNGIWKPVTDSAFNRRLTADSPMQITGPARGSKLVRTEADPEGTNSLGTWANCGCGKTPWGTYLTCEENFNGYFSSSDPDLKLSLMQKRYGIRHQDWGVRWSDYDSRFDISRHPNEANRVGYVVEIDPLDPGSTPKKRTALGRFKHENAELVIAENGHAVIYMGDDERAEFIYRFVSQDKYDPDSDNRNLLQNGSLYAARFDVDGSGEWKELSPETTGMADQAEICVFTRLAASTVDATTMDRPEWVAANPHAAEVYCALTNNTERGIKPNKGGDPTPAEGPNPRVGNPYGQIVRWRPDNGDHTASTFSWDLFAVAGNPAVFDDEFAGSDNINLDNVFSGPDGLVFDSNGMLWIQTDGNFSNQDIFAGMGNNQMLVADPVNGDIRRFMVGPRGCEVTGLCWSPDRKTAFAGIQHPGPSGNSHFPEGGDSVARSCIVAIRREDDDTII